ncbi:LytR/AlgR family response regulator transcription factor [Flavobacterium reichenbachii]|uniref:LytTR family transcriptional regulator n=1 Tax=Flavobacterium reichenbachii TaxID=362418 RepID=A0A085ZJV3_9FLAO|nr:LytTR family transcriptional regulator DNA-binding domain-containing protein [Flavobacterium reichenbachii]KFF04717.1 LytTR family transcriptional regulator [Flavobacterium reichenbachii]OXB10380.1 DNA-binding response regulator [Flavobacterium reichenbachii]
MKKYSYIIIDDDAESILKTRSIADGFSELDFLASASTYEEGLRLVLEQQPAFIFLEIAPRDLSSNLSLSFISELYRFLAKIPKIIITTSEKDLAFEAIKYDAFDYILKPVLKIDLLKLILKLDKSTLASESIKIKNEISASVIPFSQNIQNVEQPLILCIKSYGDYRYIDTAEITYFQADNNSTDIYLQSGEMITAFKTLKHFEGVLSYPFFRIHNSYMINRNYISRIHSGHSVCYIKNSSKKIPFSKTYKSNIDFIIADYTIGNYLEV